MGGAVPDYLSDLIATERRRPSEARGVIYCALFRAARRGEPCPSHEVLNELAGYSSTSASPTVVANLERAGLIRVWRYQRYRVVQIVATGKKTRAPQRECLPHVPRGARSIHNHTGLIAEA